MTTDTPNKHQEHKVEDITVQLIDSMGTDSDIDKAARLSYDQMGPDRSPEQQERLIRYLLWHRHTSPFEMVEFKFLVKLPIFVARQMVRHRTASLNEVSRRYTDVDLSFHRLELRQVDTSLTNQGSGTVIAYNDPLYETVLGQEREALDVYNQLLDQGVAKECARVVLPLNLNTKWVWKIDLHNLLHFLDLRWDSHAQKEIREVASQILALIEPIVPITVAAFRDWKSMKDVFQRTGYQYFRGGKAQEYVSQLDQTFAKE